MMPKEEEAPFDHSDCESNLVFSGDSQGELDFIENGFVCLEEVDYAMEEEEVGSLLRIKTTKKPKLEKKPRQPALKNATRSMEEWSKFDLNTELLSYIPHTKPTAIQEAVLSKLADIPNSNILGSAPTGSGKTLAFGIPLLDRAHKNSTFKALILVPTRELALQIRDVFREAGPSVRTVAIVGGMSEEKQEREVTQSPQVIVATPGRLVGLIQEVYVLESFVKAIDVLVLDEADRLLDAGHFRDLVKLITLINPNAQKMLFSATLQSASDKEQQKIRLRTLKSKLKIKQAETISISEVPSSALPASLSFYSLPCSSDPDCGLFVLLQSTRFLYSIVFVNAISMLKRIKPLLEVLGLPCVALHAQMQQRARLKALDKFKEGKVKILLATDVVGRGIDLPLVDQVIHYQIPPTQELLAHRSGRAARAGRPGRSIFLDSSAEYALVPEIDPILVDAATPILAHARKLEYTIHKRDKKSREKRWMKKAAQDLEIDLSASESDSDAEMWTKAVDKAAERALKDLHTEISTFCKRLNRK